MLNLVLFLGSCYCSKVKMRVFGLWNSLHVVFCQTGYWCQQIATDGPICSPVSVFQKIMCTRFLYFPDTTLFIYCVSVKVRVQRNDHRRYCANFVNNEALQFSFNMNLGRFTAFAYIQIDNTLALRWPFKRWICLGVTRNEEYHTDYSVGPTDFVGVSGTWIHSQRLIVINMLVHR